MKGQIKSGGTKGSISKKGGAKAQARQTIRKQTRVALRKGMPVKPSNQGLGITKGEGRPKVRKAIKTLGYGTSEKVVQRTKKRVTTTKKAGAKRQGKAR
jgi:hypothetical protein